MNASPSTVRIAIDAPPGEGPSADEIRESLSAVAQTGRHLWLGCDETATLERVTEVSPGVYGHHRTFRLAQVLDLPAGDEDEVDVEGLAWEPPYLWVVGSHGRKRGKPKPAEGVEAAFAELADVDTDDNRYLLARIPLEEDPASGGLVPRRACPDPRDPSATLTAARLRGRGPNSQLIRALRKDPHLRAFRKLPGKDNGLDVEGLAAADRRLFLGLRGPVLRGWAVVLEVEPEEADRAGRLKLRGIGPEGRRYRKHFLDLDGLGVRELARDGDDLLVLAGPTMDVRAPATLFRWRGAVRLEADSIAGRGTVDPLLDLPHDVAGGSDHPEGLCRYEGRGVGEHAVLVVYDSAGPRRRDGDAVLADVFALPHGGEGPGGGEGSSGGEPGGGMMDRLFPARGGGTDENTHGGEG